MESDGGGWWWGLDKTMTKLGGDITMIKPSSFFGGGGGGRRFWTGGMTVLDLTTSAVTEDPTGSSHTA